MEAARDAGRLPQPRGRRAARGGAPSRRPGRGRRGASRWRGPAGDTGRAALLTAALAFAVLVLGIIGAVYSATTQNPSNTLTADSLNAYVPTAVTASRTASTTCLVSWTPVASPPAGLTYDVTDGTGTTVVTGASGTSASATVAASAVTPTVKARLGSWVSSASTAASSPCNGWPDAPVVTLTPSDGAVAASWTAPNGNGGTVASYTATISPAPGSGSATCTVSAPTTACSWSSLTNGLTYTVSVTATSNVGTGPAGTATAIPYPSTVMSPSALVLWLDGADPSTMFASSTCSGAAATTTVGCWRDKSTRANDVVQSADGYRPALAAAAGRSVPLFDGTDDRLSLTPSLLPSGTASSTSFVVAALDDPTPAASGYRVALSWGSTGSAQGRTVGKVGGSADMFGDLRYTGGVFPAATWRAALSLFVHEVSATGSRGAPFGWGTWSSSGPAPDTGTSSGFVGLDLGGDAPWLGRVPEVVVLATTVTDAQRRAVEEYLSRKWSMTIAPGAPTAVTGSATSASSTSGVVGWTAPAYDGGSAITSYTATAVPAAGGSTVTCSATAPSTSCTLTGLAGGGARYSVTVTATNSAGTGPASSAATVFSGVPSAANVKLWLAADDLDGNGLQAGSSESGLVAGAVQTWKDKSGGGLDVTAPSAAERPAYASYTLGGYAVPTFNGTTVLFGSGTNPYGITADRSLFVVSRGRSFDLTGTTNDPAGTWLTERSTTSDGVFSIKACSGSWAVVFRNDATPYGNPATCVSGGNTVTAGRVDLVEGFRSGSSISTTVSGSPGSTATDATTITQNSIAIGRNVTTTTTSDADVAEVLLYNAALSGSSKRAVENYLAAKWGVSLAPYVATGVTATPTGTSGQLAVSWTAPTDIGGSALTLYTARTTTGGFSCTATPPATTCTLTGLTDGTTYTVYVQAKNSTGSGDRSATTTGTPATQPGAPTGVSATTGDTTSTVSWTAPASTGGSAITSYTATAVPGTGSLPNVTCTSASSPCTLTGLVDGVTYTVTVAATNAVGTGASSSSVTVTPYPTTLLSAAVLWLDASDATTRYSDAGCTTLAGTSSGTAVGCWKDKSSGARNATAGTSPTIGATAMNGRTVLSFNGTNQLTTTRPTANDMTLFGVVRTSSTTGTSSDQWWNGAPILDGSGTNVASDYGFTLTGGVPAFATGNPDTTAHGPVSVADGSAHVAVGRRSGGALEASSDGGTRGTATSTNTGALTASNAFKLGKNTNSKTLTGDLGEVLVLPSAMSRTDERTVLEYLARKWGVTISPQAPSGVTAVGAQSTQSAVSWTAPSWNGGSAVTSYTVTSSPGGLTCTTASTSCTVTGLTNGTSYTFTVTATNAVGTGPASSASSAVTPSTTPGAPTGVGASPSTTANSTGTVSWTAPASNGGAAVSSYTVTGTSSDATAAVVTQSCASSPCTVTGFTDGALYTVTVAAVNASGTGTASSGATVTTYPAAVMTSAATQLWLDGADGSTLYTSSGCSGANATSAGTIGCWTDKSTQADNAVQATGSLQATVSSLNGRTAPTFDGVDDTFGLTVTKLPTGTTPSTIWAVAVQQDTAGAGACFRHVIAWGTNSTGAARIVHKGCSTRQAYLETFSTWTSMSPTQSWTTNLPSVFDGVVTPTSVTVDLNGQQSYTYSGAVNTGSSAATLGGRPTGWGSVSSWQGRIAEVVVTNTAATSAQTRVVQEYLARKWGLTITPAAPVSPAATPGATGTATVSWTAPAWNGGAAVTSYAVTTDGGGTCSVTGTTASCTGVTAGSRTFTVTATNSVGTGPSVTTTATVS